MGKRRSKRLPGALAIVAGSLALCWPAFVNGFPLLFPDSVNYLNDGSFIFGVLLGGPFSSAGWMRSPLYSLVIFPFHWGHNPWPVMGLQALVTAWMLWLVVRSLGFRHGTAVYFGLIAFLSFFTGLAWVVSWILPDIFSPVLLLGLYLLLFSREALSRTEAALTGCLVVVSVASHPTQRIMALTLCALLGLALLLWPQVRSRARSVLLVTLLVVLSLGAQVALNGIVTGRFSVDGPHPPFLMARLVADGTARPVLQKRCGETRWILCRFTDRLPADSNEFLWGTGNVMASVTPEEAEQLRREELPLLWAILQDDPVGQVRASLGNFGRQLVTYGLDDFRNNPWAASAIRVAMPAAGDAYHRSLQARDALPLRFFSAVQSVTVPVAVILLTLALPYCWKRRHARLLGLSAIVLPAILGNAFLTAVFSIVDSRYQLRVVWLLPLLASLVLLQALEDRKSGTRSRVSNDCAVEEIAPQGEGP